MIRVTDIYGVYHLIRKVSEAHLNVAKFDSGESNNFSTYELYPLAYLEEPFQITEEKNHETFNLALNILDRIDGEEDRLVILSKCKQTASDIKFKLEELLSQQLPANYLTFRETGDDQALGVRMEVFLPVPRHQSKCQENFREITL